MGDGQTDEMCWREEERLGAATTGRDGDGADNSQEYPKSEGGRGGQLEGR